MRFHVQMSGDLARRLWPRQAAADAHRQVVLMPTQGARIQGGRIMVIEPDDQPPFGVVVIVPASERPA